MPTSTFERKIVFSDKNSVRRFTKIMSDQTKARPIAVSPYTQQDRDKSEQLLKRALSRSKIV